MNARISNEFGIRRFNQYIYGERVTKNKLKPDAILI